MQKRKNTWKRVPLREIRDLLREQGLDEPASTSKDAKTPMDPAPVKQPTVRAGGGLSPVVSRGFKNNRLWIDKELLRRLYGRAPQILMDPALSGLERYHLADLRAANREARIKHGF